MLGRLRMTLEECESAYLRLVQTIFTPRRNPKNYIGRGKDFLLAEGKFDAGSFEDAIIGEIQKNMERLAMEQEHKDTASKDPQAKTAVTREAAKSMTLRESRDPICKVFVVTVRTTNTQDALLRSYKNPKMADTVPDCAVWQACRATSAAKTFFDSIQIGSYGQMFSDGGLKYNNPVNQVMREARQLWGNERQIFLLSIGTGDAPGKDIERNIWHIVSTIKDMVTESNKTANEFYYNHNDMVSRSLYHRFNVAQGLADVGLDEYTAFGKIVDASEAYMDRGETNTKLEACIIRILHLLKGRSVGSGQTAESVHGIYGSDFATRSEALKALFSSDPEIDRSKMIDRKGQIVRNSCKWVLDCPSFRSWWRSNSQLLWITGGAGKGKTMMSAFLIEEIPNWIPPYHGHLFYFFCDYQDPERNSAVYILRGLLHHISRCCPVAHSKISKKLESGMTAQFYSWKFDGLWDLFEDIVRDDNLGSLYCIIDGFDECAKGSIKQLLTKFNNLFTSNGADKALPSFRLIISSRKILEISSKMSQHLQLDLDSRPFQNIEQDIYEAVRFRVGQVATEKQWPESLSEEVIEEITKKAEGTFLWASLVIEELRDTILIEVQSTLYSLPPGLYPLYERMLLQIDGKRRHIAAIVLLWVVGSLRPLNLSELGEVLRRKFGFRSDTATQKVAVECIQACGSMISVQDGLVRMVHQTSVEYLLQGGSNLIQEIRVFGFTTSQVHTDIAEFCFSYLQDGALEGGAVAIDLLQGKWASSSTDVHPFHNSSEDDMKALSRIKDFPLLPYAALMWPRHARKSTDKDAKLFDPAAPLYNDSHLKDAWLGTYWVKQHERTPKWFSVIHLACFLGLKFLLRRLLCKIPSQELIAKFLVWSVFGESNSQSLVNRQDSYGRTPLWYAASNGYGDIVEILVNANALLEVHDYLTSGEGDTPLLKAAKLNHGSLVQQLVRAGANVSAKDKYGSTPLHEVAYHGDETASRLLLSCTADVNARDYGGRTPLLRATRDSFRRTFVLGQILLPSQTNGMNTNEASQYKALGRLMTKSPQEMATSIITFPRFRNSESNPIRVMPISGEDLDHNPILRVITFPRLGDKFTFVVRENSTTGHVNMAVVTLLLQHGCDINAINFLGETSLRLAAESNNGELVDLLMTAGADCEIRDYGGVTPLFSTHLFHESMDTTGVLRQSLDQKMFLQLLSRGANINAVDFGGMPLWYKKASISGEATFRILVKQGADVRVPILGARTALNQALMDVKQDLAALLIEAGVDIRINGEHHSPLTLAILQGFGSIALILLQNGYDPRLPDNNGQVPLYLTLHSHGIWRELKGKSQHVVPATLTDERLLEQILYYNPPLNQKDALGWTTLQYAAKYGTARINSLLLEKGADDSIGLESFHDQSLNPGATVLHIAATNVETHGFGVFELYLRRRPLDIFVQDCYGFSPLHMVSLFGTLIQFSLVYNQGQEIGKGKAKVVALQNNQGLTALDLAAQSKTRLWFEFINYQLDTMRNAVVWDAQSSRRTRNDEYSSLYRAKIDELLDDGYLTKNGDLANRVFSQYERYLIEKRSEGNSALNNFSQVNEQGMPLHPLQKRDWANQEASSGAPGQSTDRIRIWAPRDQLGS
ncbi:hypothetical protein ACLMJK_006186 [Lecanora helva]